VGLFEAENYAILSALVSMLTTSEIEEAKRELISLIFVNISTTSPSITRQFVENQELMAMFVARTVKKELRSTQLLSNMSRTHSDELHILLQIYWPCFTSDILDELLKADKEVGNHLHFMGYILLNLTTLQPVRKSIVDEHLPGRLLPLLSPSVPVKRRYIAVCIARNISFDDELHEPLLTGSAFITAVLAPLADRNDELDDEERAKLPVQLQYHDMQREEDGDIRLKLVETLYQLCATVVGRESLRSNGAYALLRELDKATEQEGDRDERHALFKRTLHSVIGVTICLEGEMGISPHLQSIRSLTDE